MNIGRVRRNPVVPAILSYEWPEVFLPIFEFVCKDCNEQFETLVYTGDIPECPKCRSKELAKRISRVSLGSGTGSSGGSKCSSCSSGHCSHC